MRIIFALLLACVPLPCCGFSPVFESSYTSDTIVAWGVFSNEIAFIQSDGVVVIQNLKSGESEAVFFIETDFREVGTWDYVGVYIDDRYVAATVNNQCHVFDRASDGAYIVDVSTSANQLGRVESIEGEEIVFASWGNIWAKYIKDSSDAWNMACLCETRSQHGRAHYLASTGLGVFEYKPVYDWDFNKLIEVEMKSGLTYWQDYVDLGLELLESQPISGFLAVERETGRVRYYKVPHEFDFTNLPYILNKDKQLLAVSNEGRLFVERDGQIESLSIDDHSVITFGGVMSKDVDDSEFQASGDYLIKMPKLIEENVCNTFANVVTKLYRNSNEAVWYDIENEKFGSVILHR
ncbi:MAG: hypothetical protein RLY93_07285 [Sumerlaeia bacterium]